MENKNNKLIHADETYSIIGCAFEIYNQLGTGFLEPVYQEALEIELNSRCIPFVSQVKLPIKYKEQILKKEYISDLICYDSIIVELKAISRLSSIEDSQLINYLKATGYKLGLLLNFGHPGKLDWKRLIY
jgi:GxxExxY protein